MNYQDLLAAAQQNPGEADYHSLRMAYARSPEYAPYQNDIENVEVLRNALHEGDLPVALEAVENLLASNYLDMEAHIAADYICTRLGDLAKSAHHRAFAKGLIDAVLATGNGSSTETAFIVLDVPEEYTLMHMLSLKPSQQALVEHSGHSFDVFDIQHPQTGQPMKLYFNIDLPKGWLDSHLNEEPGSLSDEE